jgi:hypothetical protein
MKSEYRSVNGKKAAGVSKDYSAEEREKRRVRFVAMAQKAAMVRWKPLNDLKRKRAELKRQVREAAEAGVFVPVQEGE